MIRKPNPREILCTLGPASRNQRVISRLEDLGVNLFRINLSHTKVEDVEKVIKEIRSFTDVPICLDSEGAQVRTGYLKEGSIMVSESQLIQVVKNQIEGDKNQINLNPLHIIDQLQVGDILSIDFNSVLAQVVDVNDQGVIIRILTGGLLGQNKAVTVDRPIKMDPLTEKDKAAFEIGKKLGIKHIALSFSNSGEDVDELRKIVGDDMFVISKIESINGIKNLKAIATRANAILIDRGDMSREVPIEQGPRAQKEIIRQAKECGAKVYVATNLLESMISSPMPTRAEVNDIFNTMLDGADGLVLAAETAIGSHPIQCAMMVARVMEQFQEFSEGKKFLKADARKRNSPLLVEPHGGLLKQGYSKLSLQDASQLKVLDCDLPTIMDAENIGIGTYSPLEGFMNQEELMSVVNHGRLLNGLVWPLPITLQLDSKKTSELTKGETIALSLKDNGQVYATVNIEDIFTADLDEVAKGVFGVNDQAHPGVNLLKSRGNTFISGRVEVLQRIGGVGRYYAFTPKQARTIFDNKGWSRIVAFHTRNVCHRVHEFIQLKAFDDFHCDGLFIHPLIGPKKPGDYSAEIILKSYELMVSNHYPHGKVLLGAYHNYPRFAGPKEALFTALCRKNFGCSHFIIGRDHAGVNGYYPKDGAERVFKDAGDVGIQPIFFKEFHYDDNVQSYVEGEKITDNKFAISGTQAREMFRNKELPPEWFMREDISQLVIDTLDSGQEVFIS